MSSKKIGIGCQASFIRYGSITDKKAAVDLGLFFKLQVFPEFATACYRSLPEVRMKMLIGGMDFIFDKSGEYY